jgi:imidazolonepropionase-like amidohydrolase
MGVSTLNGRLDAGRLPAVRWQAAIHPFQTENQMRIASCLLPLAAIGLLISAAPDELRAQDRVWALTNARIETVTRGVIERGTVVIRDGLIEAVGAGITPPPDARVLDLSGRTIYPGLIDLTSSLGLPAAPAAGAGAGQAPPPAAAAAPTAPAGPVGLEPQRVVADELRFTASDVRAARDAGITAVLVAPQRGAFRGQSALVPLRDSLETRHVIRSPVGLHMGFEGLSGGRYPGTLLGVIAYQRQAFYDARRQGLLLERYRSSPRGQERPGHDPQLAALVPYVRGELPVFFAASNEREMRRAISVGREFGLQLTLVGVTEGFRSAPRLAALGRPVVVSVDFPQSAGVTGWFYRAAQPGAPDSAAADSAARRVIEGNAAALNRAGVRFALASGGSLRPAEFLANVRKAVAAGLARDTALAALTIRPAEIVGVAEQLGSIEPGKIANLVVSQGDLLGDSATVQLVFVDGIRYEVIPPTTPGRGEAAAGGAGRGRGAAAAPAPADVAGTWDLVVNSPGGDVTVTMMITQSGTSCGGQTTSDLFSASLTSCEVSGRTVTWSFTATIQGQTITVSGRGEVEGNRTRGTIEAGEFGSMTYTGTRRP